jgi:hypothetical protein
MSVVRTWHLRNANGCPNIQVQEANLDFPLAVEEHSPHKPSFLTVAALDI